MTRFVFVTGGVASSLGKGLATASLGALLQDRGFSIRLRKLDPYLNVDPGTMSPAQHGEVFVTEDGAETDLDLGHYERFTGMPARRSDSITAGRVYRSVINRERRGEFLGATVQVIPHITDTIKAYIREQADDVDFVICEIGGTVGDIEGLPFLEAIRQMRNEVGSTHTMFVHLTLIPYIRVAGELKTKPTQHSVKELLSAGIQADLLICRSERSLDMSARQKIAQFCNLSVDRVISGADVANIYHMPIALHEAGTDREVMQYFGFDAPPLELTKWKDVVSRMKNPEGSVNIAIIGKYLSVADSYKSLTEALRHGGITNNIRVQLSWVDAESMNEEEMRNELVSAHGVLVPGGFGERGTAGKIAAADLARQYRIPFFGICFGMQMAVIAAIRHLQGMESAGSTEFGQCHPAVIGLLTEWTTADCHNPLSDAPRVVRHDADGDLGGTMRLGVYDCVLSPTSRAHDIYHATRVSERHRHRYEVNIRYREQIEAAGLTISGMSPDGVLPEIIEITDHPWYIGVQFHPELRSRPFQPHPLFASFVAAAVAQSRLV